jgi:hypothetical protein
VNARVEPPIAAHAPARVANQVSCGVMRA